MTSLNLAFNDYDHYFIIASIIYYKSLYIITFILVNSQVLSETNMKAKETKIWIYTIRKCSFMWVCIFKLEEIFVIAKCKINIYAKWRFFCTISSILHIHSLSLVSERLQTALELSSFYYYILQAGFQIWFSYFISNYILLSYIPLHRTYRIISVAIKKYVSNVWWH